MRAIALRGGDQVAWQGVAWPQERVTGTYAPGPSCAVLAAIAKVTTTAASAKTDQWRTTGRTIQQAAAVTFQPTGRELELPRSGVRTAATRPPAARPPPRSAWVSSPARGG